MALLRSYLQHLHLRLLLALCLIGVGTTFGALALSGYYSAQAPQKRSSVASNQPTGSQLVRATPRQRFVAIEAQATKPVITHTIAQATTQAATETLPWAKPNQPIIKSPPREAVRPKDKPKDTKDIFKDAYSDTKETRPQKAAAPWPWSLFSN